MDTQLKEILDIRQDNRDIQTIEVNDNGTYSTYGIYGEYEAATLGDLIYHLQECDVTFDQIFKN